jgi:hypothetical protein
MDRRKLPSAALFLTIFGAALFLPPMVLVFNGQSRFLGVPIEVIYLFAVWLGLVAATAILAWALPNAPPPAEPGEGES